MFNKSVVDPYKSKMGKVLENMENELRSMRAGRANPGVLEKITIDYYGVPTPITQVGSVSVPEAKLIVFQPWDASVLKDVEKAIQKSDIGINPNNDGKVIRLNFPPLTEERRRELTKTCKKYGEEAKISVRTVRRDAIDSIKTLKKDNSLSEDDLKDGEAYIQEITDKFIADIDKIVEAKNAELMEF